MKLADVKNIAGIQFIYPSELKEQLYKRFSSIYELGKACDRDTLRQFAKEFCGDTRKLKKEELVELVWAQLKDQAEKTEIATQFLIDKSAPTNATDIALLIGKGLSPQTVCACILATLVTYKDLKGHTHNYEDSTIVKTYLPKINRVLLTHGEFGQVVSKLVNNHFKAARLEVDKTTDIRVVERHNDLKPISQTTIQTFIESVVERCESGSKICWLSVGLALGLLTGRRQAEIFGDAEFVKVDATHIMFSGQMKMKSRQDVGAYVIPVFNADWVVMLIGKLTEADKRGKTKVYVNETISANYSRTPRLTKPLGLSFFKDSRVAYALYHCTYSKPESITIQAYLGRLMGHGEHDLETSNSYQKFKLVD